MLTEGLGGEEVLTESFAPGRAQSASTYKMLNVLSKKEEYYADPIFRVLWLIASTAGVSLPRPCARHVSLAPLVSCPLHVCAPPCHVHTPRTQTRVQKP